MVKILIAEDDRALNSLVSMRLRDMGYEIKSCYDGREALSEIEKKPLPNDNQRYYDASRRRIRACGKRARYG